MVSLLDRKLYRDVFRMKGQVLAISLVVACGVATFVTTRIGYESLRNSQSRYYENYAFADVFASLKRAPESLGRKIGEIPGVRAVETRLVYEVTLDVPGLAEPATGRIISIPESARPVLNQLHLRSGRYVERGARDEVIVSEAFASANALGVGDRLTAVLNGRWQPLRVVGIALSPEYIYEIGGGSLFPDNRRFGVLWMARDVLSAVFQMEGAFNDVSVAVDPEASEADIVENIDRLLRPFGGVGAYGRKEQVSHQFITDEIRQNQRSGVIMPVIFMGVAAFLIHIALMRLVHTQREQIGILRAFGFQNTTIGAHYLKLAGLIVLAGSIIGVAMGIWWGRAVNRMYGDFYRFPILEFQVSLNVLAPAVVLSAIAAAAGASSAVRRALRLTPAEAMQPEPPARFAAARSGISWWMRRLPITGRVIVRNLQRRPTQAVLSLAGIGFATAILVTGRYSVDAIHHIANVQFRQAQRDDATLVFNTLRPGRVEHEASALPGVRTVEPFRAVPVRVRFEHRSRKVMLMGLEADGTLRRLVAADGSEQTIPPDGVVMTAKLAEILEVGPGRQIDVQLLEGRRALKQLRVSAIVDELVGLGLYMDASALQGLLGEERMASGAYITMDESEADQLYSKLKRLPGVSGVALRRVALASFEDTIARSIGLITVILIGFAGAIAFAVVYNTSRIALAERSRELASLRVLGFTKREVASMLLGEQALILAAGIPLGLVMGHELSRLLSMAYRWELFRLPFVITPASFAYAFLAIAASAALSWLVVRQRVYDLDLVSTIKTRD